MSYHRIWYIIVIGLLMLNVAFAQDTETLTNPQVTDSTTVDSLSGTGFWVFDIQSGPFSEDYVSLFYAVIFFILAFMLIMYLRQPLKKITERSKSGARHLTQIIPIFLVIAWLIVILVITRNILGLSSETGLLLFLIIGFAFSLASRGILKDIIAGLIVPFEIHLQKGNKIRFGNIYGEIVQIGIRKIVLRAANGQVTIIPNHQLLNEVITDIYSDKNNYPVCADFYLPEVTDLNRSKDIIYKTAVVSPYLYLDKPIDISFSQQILSGRSLIRMRVQAYLRQIETEKEFINELTTTVSRDILNAANPSDS